MTWCIRCAILRLHFINVFRKLTGGGRNHIKLKTNTVINRTMDSFLIVNNH